MKRNAFTLIELLVVIAIIAILAAILFPVFAQARATARKTACLSNMKQLTLGMLQYVQDYDERFPSWNWSFFCDGGNQGLPRDSAAFWTMAIYPYVKNDGVYQCQDDPLQWNDAWASCSDDGGRNDRFAPINAAGQPCNFWDACNPRYVSYGLSETLTGSYPTNKLGGISTPANWGMFFDCATQLADIWVWQRPDSSNYNNIPARVAFSTEGCCKIWEGGRTADSWIQQYGKGALDQLARHQGGENVTFVDGHAKFFRWTEITWGNMTTGSL